MQSIELNTLGVIKSPYKQKFAIPRQPRLVPDVTAELVFHPEFSREEFVRGIEDFTHLWLLFVFHETADKGWSPLVRPPRLGGNAKKGVFATRATFRPNPIGMSAVELKDVVYKNGQLKLILGGVDLLDGTPIVDIKPYLPYSDAIVDASAGFADVRPETDMQVAFNPQAEKQIEALTPHYPALASLIKAVLLQDPRPAYKKQRESTQSYGMTLYDLNIKWQVQDGVNQVLSVERHT